MVSHGAGEPWGEAPEAKSAMGGERLSPWETRVVDPRVFQLSPALFVTSSICGLGSTSPGPRGPGLRSVRESSFLLRSQGDSLGMTASRESVLVGGVSVSMGSAKGFPATLGASLEKARPLQSQGLPPQP